MKKGSASLVVLSIMFLITALLIYLFEYVSIERMMYVNRINMKQFEYNSESLENIITKDIEATYLNGGDIDEIAAKDYQVFEGQKVKIYYNGIAKKNAIKIHYAELMNNDKERTKDTEFSLLNRIFLKDQIGSKEKEDFLNLIKENQVQEFTIEEINNYFLDTNDVEKTFDFGNAIVKINKDASMNDIKANINGSGILIIDGDITIHGEIDFSGLIIIDGELKIEGSSDIYGTVIDIKNKSKINYTKSLHTMYAMCKNYKGIIKVTKSNY